MKAATISSVILLGAVALFLSSCASGGDYSTTSSASPYASSPFASWYDSPMAQQVRMQEAQSRVMRSMIPF
ncbi:MAG: hypothetical protein KDN19_20340 [Verrucomicrobiae bacterium]|nr:hypothetical protein [Verrucomicrobiae bacterium]